MSWEDGPLEETPRKAAYRSFLVRCWRVGAITDDPSAWRFMVLEAGGGTPRRVFAGLDGLTAYLRDELEVDRPRGPGLWAGEVKREKPWSGFSSPGRSVAANRSS